METGDRGRNQWSRARALSAVAVGVSVAVVASSCADDARIPAQFTRPLGILVPVSIGGAESLFLLDTGSETTLVTPSVSARLQPTGRTKSAFSRPCAPPGKAEVFHAGEIRFAGGRLKYPEEVGSLELATISAFHPGGLGGILGWDVLANYVVGIDISGGRLLSGRKKAAGDLLAMLGAPGADAELKLKIVENRPTVTASAGRWNLRLVLDTGAGSTIIHGAAWRRMSMPLPPEDPASMVIDINGSFPIRPGHIEEILLGALRLEDVSVGIADDPACVESGDSSTDGVLGRDILSRYIAVIDGPGQTLYLARRPAGG
jgi:aspartyl protease